MLSEKTKKWLLFTIVVICIVATGVMIIFLSPSHTTDTNMAKDVTSPRPSQTFPSEKENSDSQYSQQVIDQMLQGAKNLSVQEQQDILQSTQYMKLMNTLEPLLSNTRLN